MSHAEANKVLDRCREGCFGDQTDDFIYLADCAQTEGLTRENWLEVCAAAWDRTKEDQ